MGAAVNASRSGDLLNDTYELCELVESRDTHQLYSARDTRNDRLVHIALLRPEVALRNGVAQRFVKGPKALSQIDHPNVGRVWSVESDATGIPFVVEEPRSGRTLASMIESFPEGMPLGVAVNLLVPVVEAMAAAHGSGLVHGAFDAKHVLLSEQGGTTVPKVFGFGTSDKPGDPSEDVRAIGALMYRALSGQAADAKRRTALDELAPHLPLELTELVERCLASKDERPSDARLLSDELNALRQKIGGQRASAVSVERVVLRDSPLPAAPKPAAKPAAKVAVAEKPAAPPPEQVEQRTRRQAIERAVTAPVEPPPEGPAAVKIDPHGATFVDAEAPKHEPEARDRGSIEFPMASSRPKAAEPQPTAKAGPVPKSITPDQVETKADEPQQTREDRGKGKPARKAAAKAKPSEAAPNEPGIAVAGPARLAAAFAPLEGAANIEQGETREAELGRAFRQQQEEDRAKREARYGRPVPLSAASAAEPKQNAQAKPAQLFPTPGAKGADGKKQPARPSAAEVIALGQLHAQEEAKKERRSRFFGAFFLMFYCLLLARGVPLLNGTRTQAEAVLGTHVKAAAMVFAVVSLVVLIKTWALQIQTRAMLLKPVTYTLKVVVICSVALCAGYLMPEGSLGFVEGIARRFLPWSAAAYFMFLGFYGLMRGIRETQANLIAGMAMTLAYGGSFVGSYMVAANVIAPNMRSGRAQAEVALQVLQAQQNGEQVDHAAVLEGAGMDPEVTAEIVKQATAEDGFREAKMVGGDEEEDMKSIREMGDARKRNSARLEDLSQKIPELTK